MATASDLSRVRPVARPAAKGDEAWLADVLARAFWDDPVFGWLHPNDRTRYAALRRFFRAELRANRRHGRVVTTSGLDAAGVWAPPKRWKADTREMLIMAPAGALLASRPAVGARFFKEMEKVHPTEAHWYLATVGADPVRKGTGAGAAVIEAVLHDCDRDGVPAYLESSKAANIPYYERFGFEVTGEVQVEDSPILHPMWRNPR